MYKSITALKKDCRFTLEESVMSLTQFSRRIFALLLVISLSSCNSGATSFGPTPVTSTAIHSVAYDAGARLLEIEFTSHEVYQYSNVPPSVANGLMSASSKGQYFNEFIKNGGYTSYHVPREQSMPATVQPALTSDEEKSPHVPLSRDQETKRPGKISFDDPVRERIRQEHQIKRAQDEGTISADVASELTKRVQRGDFSSPRSGKISFDDPLGDRIRQEHRRQQLKQMKR